MRCFFSFQRAHSTQRVYRTALVAILLGAILTFMAFSFAPPAHAAAPASPAVAALSHVKITTRHANSILVKQTTPLILAKCYNTPTHTVTITGLVGVVDMIGYSIAGCSGSMLCRVFADIPPGGNLVINLAC